MPSQIEIARTSRNYEAHTRALAERSGRPEQAMDAGACAAASIDFATKIMDAAMQGDWNTYRALLRAALWSAEMAERAELGLPLKAKG